MAGQDSNDRIAELLKKACPPAEASPEFKARLRQQIVRQSALTGAAGPTRPLWLRPLLWMPAAAAAAAAMVLVIYFAAFRSTGLVVVTSNATGVETTTATLNGNLDNLPACNGVQVSFEWGTDTGYGQETAPEVLTADGSIQAGLSNLEPNTTYHYRLKVVGEDDVKCGPDRTFTTGPDPPAVTTGSASGVGPTSAVLAGSLDAMGSSRSIGACFQWGLTEGYGRQTRVRGMTEAGEFTVEISGLSPGTTYHFRAKADGDGKPVFGADMTFTTSTTRPSVETGGAIGTGPGSVRLTGRLTSPGSAESVAASFLWGTTPGGPYTGIAGEQTLIRDGDFSADLSGLQPGETYYYMARAEGDGEPVFGAEVSFTAPTAPPGVTTGPRSEVHAESATLHAMLTSPGTAARVEVYFEWGLTPEYGHRTTPQAMTDAGPFSAAIDGIAPETTYHFRAVATGHGDAAGANHMFTTGRAAPEQAVWYLGDGLSDNCSTMYQGDDSRPKAAVALYSGGKPACVVWSADRPAAAPTVYPAGDWSVSLLVSRLNTMESIQVEIGTSDNTGAFLSYGGHTFSGTTDNTAALFCTCEDNITVGSFTVTPGSFVAVRVTPSASRAHLQTGGDHSFVRSPAYPRPTAPTVATTGATDARQTSGTLKGSLEGLGTAGSLAVYFEWGLTTDYGNRLDAGHRDSVGAFSGAIDGLAPDTTYHFRAVAEGDGTAYGSDLEFTTLP